MRKEKLDFIIIGAQKAGTTLLSGHLQASQDTYIPAEKEIPFFLEPAMLQLGWQWYLSNFFKGADSARLWGTSTPQYMMHPECFGSIKATLPNVKIIVTLRDPLRRLVSHFDMAKRLGVERGALDEVIRLQLCNLGDFRAKSYPDHTGKYVTSGEYGRILDVLYQHFTSSQVLVLFFDDIMRDPQREVDRMSDFLAIRRFAVSNPSLVRMQGGAKRKVPLDHNRIISAASKFAHSVGFSKMIPSSLKNRVGLISSWLDEWNVDPSSKTELEIIEPAILQALRQHYLSDALLLEKMGIYPPWVQR